MRHPAGSPGTRSGRGTRSAAKHPTAATESAACSRYTLSLPETASSTPPIAGPPTVANSRPVPDHEMAFVNSAGGTVWGSSAELAGH